MGLSEAYMKIFPEIRLKDSNMTSVFVPLGKREDISRYLLRTDPDWNYAGIELFEIADREGFYYEKPNWVDKYLRRDRTEWIELCLPQYVKMFDPVHKEEKQMSDDENENAEDIDNALELRHGKLRFDYADRISAAEVLRKKKRESDHTYICKKQPKYTFSYFFDHF